MGNLIEMRGSYGDLIKGVGIDFMEVFNDVQDAYVDPMGEMVVNPRNKGTALIKEFTTTAAKVHFSGKTGVGLTKLTAEGADWAVDSRIFGYRTDVVPQKYTNSVSVTEEAREDVDRRWRAELDEFRDLTIGAYRREAQAMFDLFNYAFTAQSSLPAFMYPYGDGKPLVSTAHPRLDGGTAQANTFSASVTQLPLTDTSLELAKINLMRQLDGRGLPIAVNRSGWVLVVPPELEKTAVILTQSTKRPGTANNDINVYDGMIGVIVSNWLTNPTQWSLIDTSMAKLLFVRRKPVSTHTVMDRNLTQTFYVGHRFAVAWNGWHGVFSSKGDSSAYAG